MVCMVVEGVRCKSVERRRRVGLCVVGVVVGL